MLAVVIALTLANAGTALAEPEVIQGPVLMKPAEIRAYNSRLTPDHPNYIRCSRVEETGSLVRKSKVCRTNQEWDRIESAGNREARETTENLQKGWTNGQN
jgi:hypothetical protein